MLFSNKNQIKISWQHLLSYICKDVGVHVSLATAGEHGDNHLPLVLFSRSNLKTHLKDPLVLLVGNLNL
jgi:hypothetical protein